LRLVGERPHWQRLGVRTLSTLVFVVIDLDRERRRSHGASALFDDGKGSQEIAYLFPFDFEFDLVGFDVSGAFEVGDAVAIDDHPAKRETIGRHGRMARAPESAYRERRRHEGGEVRNRTTVSARAHG
jgi:hypothetical protein